MWRFPFSTGQFFYWQKRFNNNCKRDTNYKFKKEKKNEYNLK